MAFSKTQLLLLAAVSLACFVCIAGQSQAPVTELCLGCICEAVSNCNRTLGCTGDVCGLFRITWAYWSDAGKPVLRNDHADNEGAYGRCANDVYCAADTVRGYMTKFSKDCNNDHKINCYDYAAIHRLGGYGCSGNLDYNYQSKFISCHDQISQMNGGNPL